MAQGSKPQIDYITLFGILVMNKRISHCIRSHRLLDVHLFQRIMRSDSNWKHRKCYFFPYNCDMSAGGLLCLAMRKHSHKHYTIAYTIRVYRSLASEAPTHRSHQHLAQLISIITTVRSAAAFRW